MSTLVDFCNKHSKLDEVDDMDEDDREQIYDEFYRLIDVEFPKSPFSISLGFDELKKLDEPFTDLNKIYIIDDRISSSNYYYSDTPLAIIKSLATKLIVRSHNGNPITLRQVLNTMIHHRHYRNKSVREDSHMFLELFEKTNNPSIFDTFFGS
jgi:hypothetical protein